MRRARHTSNRPRPTSTLSFDAQAARAFGRVAASLRRAGRKVKARAYDAMIAATALANGLPVYTCNPDDFSGIEGLEVIPVPLPEVSAARGEIPDETPDDPDGS